MKNNPSYFARQTLETLRQQENAQSQSHRATGIAPGTIARRRRDEVITRAAPTKICAASDANIGDAVGFAPDRDEKNARH